jgi:hypothetical protein
LDRQSQACIAKIARIAKSAKIARRRRRQKVAAIELRCTLSPLRSHGSGVSVKSSSLTAPCGRSGGTKEQADHHADNHVTHSEPENHP